MIMWSGQRYPIYGLTPPEGMYGHVEPVIGIQSNHPLNDSTVYDDDVVVHFTDGGVNTVHRPISTLPGKWVAPATPPIVASVTSIALGFVWVWLGDEGLRRTLGVQCMPASLRIDPWKSEPDTRSGEQPEALGHAHREIDCGCHV